MITYQLSRDLTQSAQFTIDNMRTYYDYHSVDWDREAIEEQITQLENWDILLDGLTVGAVRLEYDDDGCQIRDIQVSQQHQNKGIGAVALEECKRLAKNAGVTTLRLRVFKISPAYNLYIRNGFVVYDDDEKFYYMVHEIV